MSGGLVAHRGGRDKKNGHAMVPAQYLEPKFVEGRVPPHDLDAEAAVLSAIMLDPARLEEVAWLRPEHFYAEAHRWIWEAVLYLRASGSRIDVVLIGTCLKDTLVDDAGKSRIAQIGGMSYLTELLNAAPAVANVAAYARVVADKAQVRRLIATCQTLVAQGYVDGDRKILAEAELRITELARQTHGSVQLLEAEEIFAPITSEEPWLCRELRLLPGRVSLVAGDPESGKSVAAHAIALAVAAGKRVFGMHLVQRSGPVLWVNWDQPDVYTVRKRFIRLARGMGLDWNELRGRIRIAHKPRLYLSEPSHLLELRALMRDHVLMVGDALTGFARGVDENSPDIGDRLRDFGEVSDVTTCTSLFIHHARKTSPGYIKPNEKLEDEDASTLRGSGSIVGAAGTVFKMRAQSKRDSVFRVSQPRNATTAMKKLDTFALRFVDVCEKEDGTGDRLWGLRVEYIDPEELAAMKKSEKDATDKEKGKPDRAEQLEQIKTRILEEIKKQPGLDSSDLYELCPSMRKTTFNTAMKLLESKQDPTRARIKDGKGGFIGDKKPKEWFAT